MEWSAAEVWAKVGVRLEGDDWQEAVNRANRPEINLGPEQECVRPVGRQEVITGRCHRK